MGLNEQIFEEDKVCSPELRSYELALHSTLCPQDPGLLQLMTTAAKAAFDFHISNEHLLVGEYEVKQSTSSNWLLCHLEAEVIVNAL